MDFNFVSNIQTCFDLVRDNVNISLIYYTHIPSAIISLIIGFFILMKNRNLLSKILFSISLVFSLWIVCSLITWTSYDSRMYMFFWSFFGILTSIIYILSSYFSYVFIFEKDVSIRIKTFVLAFILPIIIITPTTWVVKYFDHVWCIGEENSIFMWYYYLFGIFSFISIVIFYFKSLKIQKKNIKKNTIFTIGICVFIIIFLFTGFLASYLSETGLVPDFNFEPYGLFGMTVFMAFLAYLIVKFKAFDIKLIATQVLVWALVILIGSQFFFIQNNTNRILTAITLVITSTIGVLLVRSVKKEVALREDLEIANNNQQSLIHFISHQLKGFFTKSKMIFAGILEDDFEKSSDTLKEAAKEGLLSDDNAVVMIQSILGVANYRKGIITYNMENVDLIEIVNNVCDSFTNEITAKGLELKKDISESPVMILADHTQISQVIKNLIDNSIKYTPAGSIKVSLKARSVNNKKKAVFEVEDTGVGLSESDKSRLFTEGGKGEESLKLNVNSTGYGLYIVKKIVENHHGKIWAESEGRGKGSIFYAVFELVG
jgi:signal transduction histidine kinase